jgi:hypothetical protein
MLPTRSHQMKRFRSWKPTLRRKRNGSVRCASPAFLPTPPLRVGSDIPTKRCAVWRAKGSPRVGPTSSKRSVAIFEEDVRRARILREEIGWERKLMMDANQVWDVEESIRNMRRLAEFKPWWIEEPTSPDDIVSWDFARLSQNLPNFLDVQCWTGSYIESKKSLSIRLTA